MKCITYKSGYKYQLKQTYVIVIPIRPAGMISTEYVALTTNGTLSVHNGYAWDGPSGLTIDTLNFMRGSLVHDALYQLMREGLLDAARYRETADRLLQTHCIEDGMSSLRAWWVYQAVRIGGGPSSTPGGGKTLHKAPTGCT